MPSRLGATAVLLATSAVQLAAAAVTEVYIIPHAHCDAGWLLTDETYFSYDWPVMPPEHQGPYGSVRRALDGVTAELTAHPEYRFVWSESIWVDKWWRLQNASTQAAFRALTASGQLEFVGGGYVQSDEATTTFEDVIDQTTTGHEFLRRNGISKAPTHGWQLDMFAGYSGATPSLWALAGYEAMVLRFEGNETLHAQWLADRAFEFVWRGSASLPVANQSIFAHVIDGNYCDLFGAGFNWEATFKDPAKNPPVTPENLANRTAAFVAAVAPRALSYRGPVMILWGCDFAFHNTAAQFGNMSLIIDAVNANASYGMHVRYATAAEYFDAAHSAVPAFPVVRGGDFLLGWPHLTGGYAPKGSITYQTGAQTSWPTYKQLVRSTGDVARAAEAAFAQARLTAPRGAAIDGAPLLDVRAARGLTQHHDSVPGTMRTSVSVNDSFYIGDEDVKGDYTAHLEAASAASNALLAAALSALVAPAGGGAGPALAVDDALLAAGAHTVLVYNALGWTHARGVSLQVPAGTTAAAVVDADGRSLPSQLLPAWDGGELRLAFVAEARPLGWTAYGIELTAGEADAEPAAAVDPAAYGPQIVRPRAGAADEVISNGATTLTFDGTTGLLAAVQHTGKPALAVRHELAAYVNATGGAYIMFENGPAVPLAAPPQLQVTRGAVVQRLCQVYRAQGANAVCFSLWHAGPDAATCTHPDLCGAVEARHDVGPLPLATELVTRFTAGFSTGAAPTLHYQCSGMEAHAWAYNASLTIPGNYKPLIHSSFLRSAAGDRAMSVTAGHTMGSASLADGQLEVMLHRSTNSSDTQGPYPLADTARVTATLALLAGDGDDVEAARPRVEAAAGAPFTIAHAGLSLGGWVAMGYSVAGAGLAFDLPPQLALLSLLARDPQEAPPAPPASPQYVLRLRHMYEAGAHPTLSAPATVDVPALLAPLAARGGGVSANETTLSMSFAWDTLARRQWPVEGEGEAEGAGAVRTDKPPRRALRASAASEPAASAVGSVTLGPVEMKTFVWTAAAATA